MKPNKGETTFELAQVGDRAYTPFFKCTNTGAKTNVTIVTVSGTKIKVELDVPTEYIKTTWFNVDGSFLVLGGQSLFWENPIREIPIRPKRKVVKNGWIGIRPVTNGIPVAYTSCIYDTLEKLKEQAGDSHYNMQQIQYEVEE